MTRKSPLVALPCLLAGACSSVDTDAAPRIRDESSAWEWVYIAGFTNPALSPDASRALDLISEALAKEEIRWAAAGSRGYSLSIDSRDMPRGREIVRQVVERYRLPVHLDK